MVPWTDNPNEVSRQGEYLPVFLWPSLPFPWTLFPACLFDWAMFASQESFELSIGREAVLIHSKC